MDSVKALTWPAGRLRRLGRASFTFRCRSHDIVEVLVGDTTAYSVLTGVDAADRDRTAPSPRTCSSTGAASTSRPTTAERFEARTLYLRAPTPGDNQGGAGQRVDRTEQLEPSSIHDFEVRSIEPNTDDGFIDLVVEFAAH